MYLELRELLHQLLLLLAVAEWREDVQENLQKVQVFSRNAGQGEDGRDAAQTQTREVYVEPRVENMFFETEESSF